MIPEAILNGIGSFLQEFIYDIWNDANRAVLFSVIGGICLYFIRSWADGRRITQSLARVLHFELEENQRRLMFTRLNGIPQADPMGVDSVYKGLLASSNIRYLYKHQEPLYRLYSMTSADDPNLLDVLEKTILSVGETACPSMRSKIAVRRAVRRLVRRRP